MEDRSGAGTVTGKKENCERGNGTMLCQVFHQLSPDLDLILFCSQMREGKFNNPNKCAAF